MNAEPHNESRCHCGTDPNEECQEGPKCCCPCQDCCERRKQVMWGWRVENIRNRLERAGIGVDDFADLIWMQIEPTIEERIHKIVIQQIREAMDGLKLLSEVRWANLPTQNGKTGASK